MGSCPCLTSPRPPQHMREAAERRQQLELEHEQALAALKAKQQEIDLLQKVRGAGCSLGGGLGGRGCCGLAAHPGWLLTRALATLQSVSLPSWPERPRSSAPHPAPSGFP